MVLDLLAMLERGLVRRKIARALTFSRSTVATCCCASLILGAVDITLDACSATPQMPRPRSCQRSITE